VDKAAMRALIAARAVAELNDGDVVNLGIGLPTLVPKYVGADKHIILHSENGIVGMGPTPDAFDPSVVNAGGGPASVAPDGYFVDSATSFGIIRGGHIDVTILGALEVDERGDIANWMVPGQRIPGMGGAMDLLSCAKRAIVAMEHTANGKPKILKKCTLPLTATKCIDRIITEMGVFDVVAGGIALIEYNPAFTIGEIQARTEAKLIVENPRPMAVRA
jgi:acetate CoA/acetoacetate CoA-transferase beta subunit